MNKRIEGSWRVSGPWAEANSVILIVAGKPELTAIWARHLERQGLDVTVRNGQSDAVEWLHDNKAEVVLLDLMLESGSAIAVADFVSYLHPETRVVFTTRDRFFSDGSIFNHIPNTAAVLQEQTPPNDLAEIVAYHGRAC